ncbi:putative Tara 1A [Operophtera brumata]|uniref:Putative Tara 1A n=1 Tax=Operophtera brumata TaxID=104452 RepID=A0A0L7LT31_OPEBR|nr:putative Tara 1A [Operophtera brumata]
MVRDLVVVVVELLLKVHFVILQGSGGGARDPAAGRATPYPAPPLPDRDSGYGDEETRSIDWGSVLSLSSRSALDPPEDAWPDDWGWSEDSFVRLLVPTS